MKTLLLFGAGALLFGAAALGLGFCCWGEEMLLQGAAAFGITLAPAALTLAWVLYSFRTTPDMRLLASLGGSGFRMAIALGGGYFLTSAQPDTFGKPFWCWVVLFYLTLLAFEMTLLVRQEPKLDGPPQA
jgi:hypothetical protein